MARDHENEGGSRIEPLGNLDDFEVAEGYPDIRGWRVNAADGSEVGKVHELLVDVDTLRTRYLDVRLTAEIAAAPEDRDVLVPIGAARIEDGSDVVVVPLTTERIGLLPPFTHNPLTREQEYEVRRHFSFGKAAAAATGAAGVASASADRDFYNDEAYDDKRFFSSRDRPKDAITDQPSEGERKADAGETEVRLPLQPDDSVVLKRGDDGRDEIIIRRPRSEENRTS